MDKITIKRRYDLHFGIEPNDDELDFYFELINSVKEECEKDWKAKVSEAHSIGYQKGKYEANVRNKRGY